MSDAIEATEGDDSEVYYARLRILSDMEDRRCGPFYQWVGEPSSAIHRAIMDRHGSHYVSSRWLNFLSLMLYPNYPRAMEQSIIALPWPSLSYEEVVSRRRALLEEADLAECSREEKLRLREWLDENMPVPVSDPYAAFARMQQRLSLDGPLSRGKSMILLDSIAKDIARNVAAPGVSYTGDDLSEPMDEQLQRLGLERR